MWPPCCQSIHFPSSSLLKGIFQDNSIDSSFMPALIYIFPLHLSCGACWNKPLFIFKGQTSAKGFIWHLLGAECVAVKCCPIAGDASRAWMIAPWCQTAREWVQDGDLYGRGVQRINTSGECRCVYQARGRRLAGHGSQHFLEAYSLIQRHVSLLIHLLLMVSQRKPAAAFNQLSFRFLFVLELYFAFFFFWLNDFKCYLLYFYTALLKWAFHCLHCY